MLLMVPVAGLFAPQEKTFPKVFELSDARDAAQLREKHRGGVFREPLEICETQV